MPEMAWGAAAYRRTKGHLPPLRLVNLHLERSPTSGGGVVLLSRLGLLASTSVGTGPVQGVFWQDGVFGGDVFTLSGGNLYRAGVLIGAVPGTGPVRMAASALELVITAGASAYSYNGTNLAAIAFPDGANVCAVAFLSGFFIFVRAGSHKFYWSAVNNGRSVDALDFLSAESQPDGLLDAVVIGEQLWLLGTATTEPWLLTGSLDDPFTRLDQGIFRKGVIATGCACDLDNSMFWVGDDGIVYRAAEVPKRVSDHWIEERIAASSEVSAFTYASDGHDFYCVRINGGGVLADGTVCPAGTFAYDVATQQWNELASYGRDNFRARCAATNGADVLLGDDETGTLYQLSGYEDAGGPFERLFTGAIGIPSGVLDVYRVTVDVEVGWTPILEGQGSDPQIEMRVSNDGGATWDDWEPESLGRQGEYSTRPEWRALGLFQSPGFLSEFRVTDPVNVRLTAVLYNEAGGGRG